MLSLPNSYGPALDIVTVGRVRASWQIKQNGNPLDPLPPTSGAKVYAPGNGLVRIAGSEVPDNFEGNFISTGIAAGLVAYFLSLPDLGTSFKSQDNVPAGVLWFLQNRVSVERIKGQKALWNGLDSEDEVGEFENWCGPEETRYRRRDRRRLHMNCFREGGKFNLSPSAKCSIRQDMTVGEPIHFIQSAFMPFFAQPWHAST